MPEALRLAAVQGSEARGLQVHPEGRAADVVMLGFEGFRVLDAREHDGELVVLIETTADRDWCRACGVQARAHARPETLVRDVAAFDRPVAVRWRKRRWRCREQACPAVTWTEAHEAISARAVPAERARQRACERVGRHGDSVAAVAREYGVGWHTVMRAVVDYGTPLVDDPGRLDGVASLGMDETAFPRAYRRHHTLYVSGLVDTATGRLLDGVRDRTAKAVITGPPRTGLARTHRRRRAGPPSRLRQRRRRASGPRDLGGRPLQCRPAGQRRDRPRAPVRAEHPTGHRGRTGDPLYGIRKLLLKACDDLDARGWQRLADGLAAGDPDGEVTAAWQLKEITRDLYRSHDLGRARDVVELLYTWAHTGAIPELRRFARTVRRWENEILNWHVTGGASNGPTEAVNLTIKQIQRWARLPHLRQLPAAPATALRRLQLATSTHCAAQETPATLSGVDPHNSIQLPRRYSEPLDINAQAQRHEPSAQASQR
jgi:transposase